MRDLNLQVQNDAQAHCPLHLLEKAYQHHSPGMVWLKVGSVPGVTAHMSPADMNVGV